MGIVSPFIVYTVYAQYAPGMKNYQLFFEIFPSAGVGHGENHHYYPAADFKNNLSYFISLVEKGEEIEVCRRNIQPILPNRLYRKAAGKCIRETPPRYLCGPLVRSITEKEY